MYTYIQLCVALWQFHLWNMVVTNKNICPFLYILSLTENKWFWVDLFMVLNINYGLTWVEDTLISLIRNLNELISLSYKPCVWCEAVSVGMLYNNNTIVFWQQQEWNSTHLFDSLFVDYTNHLDQWSRISTYFVYAAKQVIWYVNSSLFQIALLFNCLLFNCLFFRIPISTTLPVVPYTIKLKTYICLNA